jgi:hypothetical protein
MTISNASHIPSKIFRHAHHVVAIIGGATSITTISVRNENWNILPIYVRRLTGSNGKLANHERTCRGRHRSAAIA